MTYGDEVLQLRRELERLREENQRLSRLLELQDHETTPAPEQPTAASAAVDLVTMASPVADKLALFTNLFRARSDVYALRWENIERDYYQLMRARLDDAGGHLPAQRAGGDKGTSRHLKRADRAVASLRA